LTFEKFEELSRVDTIKLDGISLISKEEYYLVSGYKNNKKSDNQIDSFYCSVMDNSSEKYFTYWVYFCRKSKKTNKLYFDDHPNEANMNVASKCGLFSYRIETVQTPNYTKKVCYRETLKRNWFLKKRDEIFECK
jgi:hypothetical protein